MPNSTAIRSIEDELLAKLDAEIAEAKIGAKKLRDDRYHEGEADGYLDGLEFARNLLVSL